MTSLFINLVSGKFTHYESWIVAFASVLFQKRILTPEELALEMKELETRYATTSHV